MTVTANSRIARPQKKGHITTSEDWIMRVLIALGTLFLLVGVVFPLYPMLIRSFQNRSGEVVGLANYIRYLTTPSLAQSFTNSLYVAIASTLITVFF